MQLCVQITPAVTLSRNDFLQVFCAPLANQCNLVMLCSSKCNPRTEGLRQRHTSQGGDSSDTRVDLLAVISRQCVTGAKVSPVASARVVWSAAKISFIFIANPMYKIKCLPAVSVGYYQRPVDNHWSSDTDHLVSPHVKLSRRPHSLLDCSAAYGWTTFSFFRRMLKIFYCRKSYLYIIF